MLAKFEQAYRLDGTALVCSNAAWVTGGQVEARPPGVRLRIGYLGRLTRDKGLGKLLDTLRSLQNAGIDADLYMAGSMGDEGDARLIEQAHQDLGERLHVCGTILGASKEQFFAGIDVFAFPTTYAHEAEPLVILEALACGAHVIAYGRGCVSSMVPSGAGLVVDPACDFSTEALPLLSAMAHPSFDHAKRQRAARAAFERHRLKAVEGRRAVLQRISGSCPTSPN